MKNTKTREALHLNPNLLLSMDVARLHALKATMEGFVEQFQKLIGLMDQDLDAVRELKRKLQGKEDKSKEREKRAKSRTALSASKSSTAMMSTSTAAVAMGGSTGEDVDEGRNV